MIVPFWHETPAPLYPSTALPVPPVIVNPSSRIVFPSAAIRTTDRAPVPWIRVS